MPLTVPTLEPTPAGDTLPAVQLQAGPPAAAFGAQEAAAVSQLGQQITRIGEIETREEQQIAAQRERDRLAGKEIEDKLKAFNAVNTAKDWIRQKAAEYNSLKGIDAIGSTNAANDEFDKFSNELIANTDNPEQEFLVKTKLALIRDDFLKGRQANEAKQYDEAWKQEIQASTDHSMSVASDSSSSAESIMIAKEDLIDTLEFGSRGMAPQTKQRYFKEGISSFHEARVNSLSALNVTAAQAYYDENKKDILPENREELEKVLKVEDVLQFSQQETDRIVATEPDQSKWLKMARDIDDPDKRKATVDNVKVRIKEADQAAKEAKQDAFLTALDQIDQTRTLSEGLAIAERVEDPLNRDKAKKHANARFEKKTKDIVTDRAVQAQVYDLIDIGAITNTRQLIEYSADLSSADYNRMITEVRNKENPDSKNVGFIKYTTAKTAYETIKGQKYDVEEDNREFMYIQEQLDKQAQVLGRDLTPAEANKFTAQYLVEGEAIGVGFLHDPDITLREAQQADQMDVWLPNVNDDDIDNGQERREIKEAYKANLNIDTDDEELLRLYKKEAILNQPLSDIQRGRLNELINIERSRVRNR